MRLLIISNCGCLLESEREYFTTEILRDANYNLDLLMILGIT